MRNNLLQQKFAYILIFAPLIIFIPLCYGNFSGLELVSDPTVSLSQINLSWDDNSNNETGFKIERKIGSEGTYSEIATVGANITTYQNTDLQCNTIYYYRLRAYNNYGNSGYSNEASTPTQSCQPGTKKALYIPYGGTDNSNVVQMLTDHGFQIDRLTNIPSDLAGYRLVILGTYDSGIVNSTSADYIKTFIQNGGGVIIMGDTSIYLSTGGYDLSSIQDWFGATWHGNNWGNATIASNNPFGTDLLVGDKVDFCPRNKCWAAGISGLDASSVLISQWGSYSMAHSFTHTFGQGRVFYYAGNPGYVEGNDPETRANSLELFEAGLLWAASDIPKCDFNGDGKTDILFRNPTTGDVGIWTMNNTTITGWLGIGRSSLQLEVVGTGDFNGDGKTDILFRNSTTGDVGIWTMNNTTITGWLGIGRSYLEWEVVGPK